MQDSEKRIGPTGKGYVERLGYSDNAWNGPVCCAWSLKIKSYRFLRSHLTNRSLYNGLVYSQDGP